MKLNMPYLKRVNFPKGPVPFEQYLPLKLRNYVSGKGQKTNDVACVQEMFVFFACLKKEDFKSDACQEEIKKLKNCHLRHMKESKRHDEFMRSGLPQPGSKKLNHLQLNTLLKQYPT